MQLVLSNNRIVAHGENFLAMGGVVINTETGAKYENATVAECEGCPSDINEVGYEYHAGTFVPCAPYGKGNNNGYFMEVCESCATPRSSGIPIKGGIKKENLHPDLSSATLGGADFALMWEKTTHEIPAQTIAITENNVIAFAVVFENLQAVILSNCCGSEVEAYSSSEPGAEKRKISRTTGGVYIDVGKTSYNGAYSDNPNAMKPTRIYAIKIQIQ